MSDLVIKEAIDALLAENPGLNRIPIRINEGTQQASVIDFIRMITGKSSCHAGEALQRLDDSFKVKCNHIRINGKGRTTWIADIEVCMQIIAALPGVIAKSLQSNMVQQGYKLKRKFSELISNGNVDISQGSTTLILQLSSATIEYEGKQIKKWDYIDHVSPTTEEVMQIIEQLFPMEITCTNNAPPEGFVYFIRIQNTSLVKIGYTTQPIESRLSQLQVAHPGQLLVDFTYHTNDYRQVERSLHKSLRNCHIRGEWFYLNQNTKYKDILTCL
jgi:hypothetical protein